MYPKDSMGSKMKEVIGIHEMVLREWIKELEKGEVKYIISEIKELLK